MYTPGLQYPLKEWAKGLACSGLSSPALPLLATANSGFNNSLTLLPLLPLGFMREREREGEREMSQRRFKKNAQTASGHRNNHEVTKALGYC